MDRLCVQLTFTSYCNFRCIGCPSVNNREFKKKKKGFLTWKTLENIAKQLADLKIQNISLLLLWVGESLLHPEFLKMLKYLLEYLYPCVKVVNLHSNLFYINKNDIRQLYTMVQKYDVTLDFVLSLDAINKQTFENIKGAKGFNKVITNAILAIKERNFLEKKENVKITCQFLVFEQNIKEAKRFIEFFKNVFESNGDTPGVFYNYYGKDYENSISRICLRRVESDIASQQYYEELHKKAAKWCGLIETKPRSRVISIDSYLNILEDRLRLPCPAPFEFVVIDYDGSVTCCWKDTQLEQKLGNVNTGTLKKIFESSLKDLRLAHIKGDLSNYPLCLRCNNFDSPALKYEDAEQYLKSINRMDLIELCKKRFTTAKKVKVKC